MTLESVLLSVKDMLSHLPKDKQDKLIAISIVWIKLPKGDPDFEYPHPNILIRFRE